MLRAGLNPDDRLFLSAKERRAYLSYTINTIADVVQTTRDVQICSGVYISGRLWTATTRHVTRPALFIIDLSHHVPHAWLAIIRAIRTAPVPAKSCRRKRLVSLTLIPHQYRSQHKITRIVNTETIVAKVQPLVYNYFYSVVVKICITFHIAIIQIQKSHSH